MVVGFIIIILSLVYLYQFTETTGIFLGGLLICCGAVGYAAGHKRNANLVNLQLVGSIVGILLAFQFISEAVRDAQVDCALAELYHRGKATEKMVDATRQTEAMHAIFGRLNELEDSLTLVQKGAASNVELRKEQQQLRFTDFNYIRAKVDMIRRHAEQVLSSVLKNDSLTAEAIFVMSDEEKTYLRKRLDTADKVLDRINKAHQGEVNDINFEEYKELLQALLDPSAVPDKATDKELQQALKELPNMQAAIHRQKSDAYHTLLIGSSAADVMQSQEQRKRQREAWNDKFQKHLVGVQRGGSDYVADLPEHCVKETNGERMVVVAGVAMVILQLAAAYIALSLSVRLPTKGE